MSTTTRRPWSLAAFLVLTNAVAGCLNDCPFPQPWEIKIHNSSAEDATVHMLIEDTAGNVVLNATIFVEGSIGPHHPSGLATAPATVFEDGKRYRIFVEASDGRADAGAFYADCSEGRPDIILADDRISIGYDAV